MSTPAISSTGGLVHSNGRRSTRVLNCSHCREKKMKCDRGTTCSNCLLREVPCEYENPQAGRDSTPPVRTQSFIIATLRRDAAQLIAKLGLSQKEVEKLALEADRQLAEEAQLAPPVSASAQPPASAAAPGVAQPIQQSQQQPQGQKAPRRSLSPYPVMQRPWSAPSYPRAPSFGSVGPSYASAGGTAHSSPEFGYSVVPPQQQQQLPSSLGPVRSTKAINAHRRSHSGGLPNVRYAFVTGPAPAELQPLATHKLGHPAHRPTIQGPRPVSGLYTPPEVTVTAPVGAVPTAGMHSTAVPVAQTGAPSYNSTMAPPPRPTSATLPMRARKARPARITLPLPTASKDKDPYGKPALTPGWLSCKPIRSKVRSPGPITPRRSQFPSLPSIENLAAPGWAN